MIASSGAEIFINVSALLIALVGGMLVLILISRRYLEAIWQSVDKIVQNENYEDYIDQLDNTRQPSTLKRPFDVILAIIFLIFFLPLLGLIAILVKLDSPGPLFISQEQIGINRRRFHTYKFRTMNIAREERELNLSNTFRSRDDPRITRIGKFLRATNLDELPKLWNVLKGDMSFVGTSTAVDFSYVEKIDPRILAAFAQSKPGIVSLWSISGKSWELDLNTRILFDLYYVKHQSLLLDIGILFRSIPSVLGRAGAM